MTAYVLERSLTQAEFDLFAKVSGDNNPIHVDPAFSARTRFGRTVSHGMLLYSVLWGLIQSRHPGARQKYQNLMFPAPAYAGEPLRFEVRPLDENHFGVKVSRIADGTIVCDGDTAIAGA